MWNAVPIYNTSLLKNMHLILLKLRSSTKIYLGAAVTHFLSIVQLYLEKVSILNLKYEEKCRATVR